MDQREFFASRVQLYRKDPILYFKEVTHFTPDDWQAEAARAVTRERRISIRSGQGVGKTAWEANILLWFLSCFPYPRVVATAPTRQQLNDVLWAEVAKWQEASPLLKEILKWTKTYIYMVGMEKRWFAVARTATKPENMQGFHEKNMLFLVDEASGVSDAIMEAILGTLTGANNLLVMCGNPTQRTGIFHDSHTADRANYYTMRVSSRDSKRTDKANIAALERKYGKDSNVVRVRVDGEFPKQDDDVFISIDLCEQATMTDIYLGDVLKVPPPFVNIGCDVARYGSDETVIFSSAGGYVYAPIVRNGQDTMRTVGDLLQEARRLHNEFPAAKVIVKVDDTGLGGGVTDRMREIINVEARAEYSWLRLVPVNFASSVRHIKAAQYYDDIATYMWAVTRDLLQEKAVRIPNDADLIAQLSIRKYILTSRGLQKLESKDAMKARGVGSPDRADALALCLLPVKFRK